MGNSPEASFGKASFAKAAEKVSSIQHKLLLTCKSSPLPREDLQKLVLENHFDWNKIGEHLKMDPYKAREVFAETGTLDKTYL